MRIKCEIEYQNRHETSYCTLSLYTENGYSGTRVILQEKDNDRDYGREVISVPMEKINELIKALEYLKGDRYE